MSDTETPMTIDDVWVNRLATKIGVLTAQNDRLMIEIEVLQQQLQEAQQQIAVLQGPPTEMMVHPNGEVDLPVPPVFPD